MSFFSIWHIYIYRSTQKCTLSVIRIIPYTIIVSSNRIDTLKEFEKKKKGCTRDTQIDIILTGHFCLGLYKKTLRENAWYRIHKYRIKWPIWYILGNGQKLDTHVCTICVLISVFFVVVPANSLIDWKDRRLVLLGLKKIQFESCLYQLPLNPRAWGRRWRRVIQNHDVELTWEG